MYVIPDLKYNTALKQISVKNMFFVCLYLSNAPRQRTKGPRGSVKCTPEFPLAFTSPPAATVPACKNQKAALIMMPFSR